MSRRLRMIVALAAASALAAGAASCSRLDEANTRLGAITSDRARGLVRDCLWRHGSHYRWLEHKNVRCEVERTEHLPEGDRTTQEVWLLDTASDCVRIEKPARREVVVVSAWGWRVFAGGKETKDLEARAEAEGDVRLVRELLPMPFSLLRHGLRIDGFGSVTGPAETRTWDRLLVRYGQGSDGSASDRMVVEIRRRTGRVEAVVIRWSEPPFFGRRFRVEMDDWRPEGDWLLAHRWRLFPVDEAGERTGPVRWTVRIRRVEVDVPVKWNTFAQP